MFGAASPTPTGGRGSRTTSSGTGSSRGRWRRCCSCRWRARGITPNQVTLATLPVFARRRGRCWRSARAGGALVAGAGIIELSYVLDCADGQLARLKGTSSPVGAHLDFLMDELKAFVLVAAVAIRLWMPDRRPALAARGRWLGLVIVAAAISLTTFMRRPEYAAATGAAVAGRR